MRKLLFATTASAFVAVTAASAHAAASDLDNCIVDIMMQCTDDDDFWGCYEVGVELCENQHSSQLKGTQINQIKMKNQRKAQQVFQRSQN